jgi:hypothetical protein
MGDDLSRVLRREPELNHDAIPPAGIIAAVERTARVG